MSPLHNLITLLVVVSSSWLLIFMVASTDLLTGVVECTGELVISGGIVICLVDLFGIDAVVGSFSWSWQSSISFVFTLSTALSP